MRLTLFETGGALVTYSSHLNDHLKEYIPVYLSSTVQVGLYSSIVFNLLAAEGAYAVANSDSEVGSMAFSDQAISMGYQTERVP